MFVNNVKYSTNRNCFFLPVTATLRYSFSDMAHLVGVLIWPGPGLIFICLIWAPYFSQVSFVDK